MERGMSRLSRLSIGSISDDEYAPKYRKSASRRRIPTRLLRYLCCVSVALTILLLWGLLRNVSIGSLGPVDSTVEESGHQNELDNTDVQPLRHAGTAGPIENNDASRPSSTDTKVRSLRQSELTRAATLRLLTAAQVEGGNVVRQLLADGADVNGKSLTGHTALQLAAQHGCSSNVQQLLAHNPDLNAQDKGGYTALMWAADRGHNAVVKQLIEAGASLAESTIDGYTALTLAEEKGHDDTAQLLLSRFES